MKKVLIFVLCALVALPAFSSEVTNSEAMASESLKNAAIFVGYWVVVFIILLGLLWATKPKKIKQ